MDEQTLPERKPVRRAVREIIETALVAALLYVLVSAAFGRFEIQQVSMEPTFHAGQRVIVIRWERLLAPIWAEIARAEDGQTSAPFAFKRGQVVVFYPDSLHDGTPLVKRVIGVPGDEVAIARGQVWINGQRLDEPYVHGLPTDCTRFCGPRVLGPDQYYMMGDNRPQSGDSRSFGPVAEDEIIGRVVLRYWPLDSAEFYP
jgi:signal peptidase I